jgi:hypothetical protein
VSRYTWRHGRFGVLEQLHQPGRVAAIARRHERHGTTGIARPARAPDAMHVLPHRRETDEIHPTAHASAEVFVPRELGIGILRVNPSDHFAPSRKEGGAEHGEALTWSSSGGKSYTTTSDTLRMSSPRAATSVATSTGAVPLLN